MNFKIWLLLIRIPLTCEISMGFIGVIELIFTNIVYFPISWFGEPFFNCNSEVGCIPKEYGRILVFLTINQTYYIYAKFKVSH